MIVDNTKMVVNVNQTALVDNGGCKYITSGNDD